MKQEGRMKSKTMKIPKSSHTGFQCCGICIWCEVDIDFSRKDFTGFICIKHMKSIYCPSIAPYRVCEDFDTGEKCKMEYR